MDKKLLQLKRKAEVRMVLIYAMDLSNIPDPKEQSDFLNRIPQIRREKTMRYKFAEARKQSLGAGILLQKVMELHNIKEEDIYIDKNGKPEAKGICFNLSHSKEMAICVVSEQAVGCDIEKIKKEPKNVAKKCFCTSELQYLESLPKEKREEVFFRIWTMKESYIKMTGEGMRLSFQRIAFDFRNDDICVLRDGIVQDCFIKEYEIPQFKITVCAKEAQFAEKIFFNYF